MPVLYEKQGPVGIATISRPAERNAWGPDIAEGLRDVFDQMEGDSEVRVAILTGDPQGGAFSAGAYLKDVKTHAIESVGEFLWNRSRQQRANNFDMLEEFPKPIICAVNGYAIGVGCLVTLCCDIIMAGSKAEWRLTQVALGIMPAYGGAVRLARWVGKGNAMRICLTGLGIKADEAYRIGLAQYLVSDDDLMSEAMSLANHIASHPPLAVRMVKESMSSGINISNLRDAAQADVYRFMALSMTEDRAEAHQAWRERRLPVFKGK